MNAVCCEGPQPISVTPYSVAQRFLGVHERKGGEHPLIQWWLSLCHLGMDQPDEVPWCSAFMNGVAWELRLPRSKRANARSWLQIGTPITEGEARVGYDVVVFWRESPDSWKGHVGLFAGWEGDDQVLVLGGNQGDGVSLAPYAKNELLGIRRLV